MTRINVVPVECLSDQHLLAEYKEITRPFNKVLKRIEKYGYENALSDCIIPEKYTLNTGHETFFFNKLKWLYGRYTLIGNELYFRKVNVAWDKFDTISKEFWKKLNQTKYWKTWEPTPEDMYLNMARLVKRSKSEKVVEELEKSS